MSIYLPVLLLSLQISAHDASDTTTVKAELIAADARLAAESATSGAGAVLRALEPNAAVLFPGHPVLAGARGSRAAFTKRYGSPSKFTWHPAHAVASTDGKFGCTMGYSSFLDAFDSVKTKQRGVYLTCWRKGKDGTWKIAGLQRNDSPARPPATADSATISGLPHSATISLDRKPVIGAQDADSLFAVFAEQASGPAPAFVRYVASDGLLVSGSTFPRGKAGIAEAFDGFSADRVITWRPLRSFGAGSGGLAFTVGHSVSGPRAGKEGISTPSKYFSVWRQEPDGRWLYIFDLGTSR